MHELSIASNIIEIAETEAKKHNLFQIDEIDLEIGELSGIELNTLKFAMDISVKNTIIEKAVVNFIRIPGRAECINCNTIFDIHDYFTFCPACNRAGYKVIQGKELRIISLKTNAVSSQKKRMKKE
ncbi:MAG: hydrogenase maturation nickel metallochaperone HypA [Bacteroidetes bacterium]|nr:hydrogenase maturation nickel metallochaperone HypA [Bacteroidota bacterium]